MPTNCIGASIVESISQNNCSYSQKYDILFFHADIFEWDRRHSTVVVVLATSSSNSSCSVIGPSTHVTLQQYKYS